MSMPHSFIDKIETLRGKWRSPGHLGVDDLKPQHLYKSLTKNVKTGSLLLAQHCYGIDAGLLSGM